MMINGQKFIDNWILAIFHPEMFASTENMRAKKK